MKLFRVLMLVAMPALAADVTGNWLVVVNQPDGNVRKTYFDLKQNGDKITGFMRSMSFDRPVEGTIDDAGNVTLLSTFPGGGGPPLTGPPVPVAISAETR